MATRRARDNDLIAFFFLLNTNYWRTLYQCAPRLDIIKTAGALKSSNRAIDYAKDTLESIRVALHSNGSIKTVSLGFVTLVALFFSGSFPSCDARPGSHK